MPRRNQKWLRGFMIGLIAFGGLAAFADESPSGKIASPSFVRYPRVAGELHRSLGSSIAEKRQGLGVGALALFPLADSGFDLGIRYVYIHEAENRPPVGSNSAFTLLTFVFDYFVWPEKLGGLYVGGEVGVTDPSAEDFFSVYSDYVYVGKIGFEYPISDSRWSASFEVRRSIRDEDPLKPTRHVNRYSDSFVFGARYRL